MERFLWAQKTHSNELCVAIPNNATQCSMLTLPIRRWETTRRLETSYVQNLLIKVKAWRSRWKGEHRTPLLVSCLMVDHSAAWPHSEDRARALLPPITSSRPGKRSVWAPLDQQQTDVAHGPWSRWLVDKVQWQWGFRTETNGGCGQYFPASRGASSGINVLGLWTMERGRTAAVASDGDKKRGCWGRSIQTCHTVAIWRRHFRIRDDGGRPLSRYSISLL